MSKREQERDAMESEDGLGARRAALETDLLELGRLIEAEHTKWQDWRRTAELLRRAVADASGADEGAARMEWYAGEYQAAQQVLVVTQGLIERYNTVARALTSCQQELMQRARRHRRG